jgi:superfamily II DNA or RNA helicase
LEIIIDSVIKIKECVPELLGIIQEELLCKNPVYENKMRLGKWVGNEPEYYNLAFQVGDTLHIPYGCTENLRIKSWLVNNAESGVYTFRNEINNSGVRNKVSYTLNPNIIPYSYQSTALAQLQEYHKGVLVAPCGSGKTNIGVWCVALLQRKALWITHTHDLLSQSLDRAKTLVQNLKYGLITEGKASVGEQITFATVQSLCKDSILDVVKNEFDIVIVDECHHCVGSFTKNTMFIKVLNSLRATYKFGLTATPKREDGLESMLYAILGRIVYEIPKNAVSETVVPIEYIPIINDTHYSIEDYVGDDGLLSPHRLATLMMESVERNNLIKKCVEWYSSKSGGEHSILVLCKRVEHAVNLHKMCGGAGVGSLLVGCVKNVDRKLILKEETKLIFATNVLAKEGLDLLAFDMVILAYSCKARGEYEQCVGRVRRKYKDKTKAYVVDIIDENISIIKNRQSKHNSWTKILNQV